jgi:hypothetical protein
MADVIDLFKGLPKTQREPPRKPTADKPHIALYVIEQCALIADSHRGRLDIGDMIRRYGKQIEEKLH